VTIGEVRDITIGLVVLAFLIVTVIVLRLAFRDEETQRFKIGVFFERDRKEKGDG
jgi:hypothetical protein